MINGTKNDDLRQHMLDSPTVIAESFKKTQISGEFKTSNVVQNSFKWRLVAATENAIYSIHFSIRSHPIV